MTNKSEYVKNWRKRAKLEILKAFHSKCGICSYDKYYGALEFHHLDQSQKDFALSSKYTRSWKSMITEVKKCVLLCSNCHREFHAGIICLPTDIQKFDENLIEYIPHNMLRKPKSATSPL